MDEIITFDFDAKKKILAGVSLLAKSVKSSLEGYALLRRKGGQVLLTRDGMLIARMVRGNDPLEDLGIRIVREKAISSQAILLTEAIVREGPRHEEELRGILKELNGIQSHTSDATVTLTSGYASPYFVTHSEKMGCELEAPYLYIADKKLTAIFDVVPILEEIKGPLVILAEEITGEALTTLVINCLKRKLPLAAVKVSRQERLRLLPGRVKHITIGKESTIITGAKVQVKDFPDLQKYPILREALKIGDNLEALKNAMAISLLILTTDTLVM